jgi:hypothetical protein
MICECDQITQVDGAEAQDYAKHLRQVSIDSAKWEVTYRCPLTGRLWKEIYPFAEAHGGGPPRLIRLD